MKIAVASGKGGTGKTMVATSLAASLVAQTSVQFIDCDVEAPNAHLFLKPEIINIAPAIIKIPKINEALCTACGLCVKCCEFNALVNINDQILIFPQLCHGCGSCTLICPEIAISEVPRKIGTLSHGHTQSGIQYFMGELTISEPMPTPIIRQIKGMPKEDSGLIILDSPPGASCAVVATLHDADFVLLVTEPTPFGLHDLKQMIGILSQTGSPGGVIINRDGIGDRSVENFLAGSPYPVLMKIPFLHEIALGLAIGELLTDFLPLYQAKFIDLYLQITKLIRREGKRK